MVTISGLPDGWKVDYSSLEFTWSDGLDGLSGSFEALVSYRPLEYPTFTLAFGSYEIQCQIVEIEWVPVVNGYWASCKFETTWLTQYLEQEVEVSFVNDNLSGVVNKLNALGINITNLSNYFEGKLTYAFTGTRRALIERLAELVGTYARYVW